MKELKLIACFGLLFIVNPNFSFAQNDNKKTAHATASDSTHKSPAKKVDFKRSQEAELKISPQVFEVKDDKPVQAKPIVMPAKVETPKN